MVVLHKWMTEGGMGWARRFGRSKARLAAKVKRRKGRWGMNGTGRFNQEESQPASQSLGISCVHTFTYRTKQVGGDEQKDAESQ